MANVNGKYRGFRSAREKSDWDIFDSLPRPIRDTLNNATVASVVEMLSRADEKLITVTRDEQEATSFLADLGL